MVDLNQQPGLNKLKTPVNAKQRSLAGGSMLIVGLYILAIVAGLVPAALTGSHADLWLISCAGGVFTIGGIGMLLRERMPGWLSGLLGSVIWTLFAMTFVMIPVGTVLDKAGQQAASGDILARLYQDGVSSFGLVIPAVVALLLLAVVVAIWWRWLAGLPMRGRIAFVVVVLLSLYVTVFIFPAEPRWSDVQDDHARLARYVRLAEQDKQSIQKHGRELFWSPPPWHNVEAWIKAVRSRLAATRVAPVNTEVLMIPVSARAPIIDGRMDSEEWQGALRIALRPENLHSTVLMLSDGKHLYVGADVPEDVATTSGGAALQFWFHLDLSPWFANENILVENKARPFSRRSLYVPQELGKPESHTETNIYTKIQAATTLQKHRQYELQLELDEAGIKPGVPFPARVQIEAAHERDANGQFKAKVKLGVIGDKDSPIWLRVAMQSNPSE